MKKAVLFYVEHKEQEYLNDLSKEKVDIGLLLLM